MNPFSTSQALTLTEGADGKITVTKQESGIMPGLLAGLTGFFNGGLTVPVGLARTLMTLIEVGAGVAVANRTDLTDRLPLIGKR